MRAQEAGLTGFNDPSLLDWAAEHDRILLTHDVTTLTAHAYRRVLGGQRMPGVVELPRGVELREAVEDILLITECSEPGEWEGQVRYLPLR